MMYMKLTKIMTRKKKEKKKYNSKKKIIRLKLIIQPERENITDNKVIDLE